MKTYNINTTLVLGLLLLLWSCGIEDYQDNPNKPSEGTPSLLLPRLIEKTFYDGNPATAGFTSQLLFYTERAESAQYWGWSTTGLGAYEDLKQAELMEESASEAAQPAYVAIAKLFKQILFYELTREVGDIPYTDALKATEGNFSPKYDTQKTVFQSILSELEDVNKILLENSDAVITGDILYNGDILKWQKLGNSYRLKILMDLSMKASDADLNIAQDFNKVFTNPATYPIFESNQDMPRFKFYDLDGNRAPTYDKTVTKVKTKLTSTLVDYMKQTTDYRLFAYAEPAWPEGSDSWSEAQKDEYRALFSSYAGLDPGGAWGDEIKKNASNIHWRYYESPTVEDYCKFTFAELNFIIAEASVRKWINADAATYYKKGVEASMSFYDVQNTDIEVYWQNPSSAFVGSNNVDDALEQINMQRWVAYFMNSNWEGYFNNRRTKVHALGTENDGVPHFKISTSHIATHMPMRWLYPQSEYSTNAVNVAEAVQRQFNKADETLFDIIWMLK